MATEGGEAPDATTTTTTRRLRARPVEPPNTVEEEEDEEDSPPGRRVSHSLKRKAIVSLEKLYLQGNYKEPLPTPLETIFESPRPLKAQRGEAQDVPSLMARRKLKRLCVFGSHYRPTRIKLKHRKERAHRMQVLTGVRVPLGKAFSEDDVTAALSTLKEDEATTCLPHSPGCDALMDSVTNVMSSLQMDGEPLVTSPNQLPEVTAPAPSGPSRAQRHKRRSGLVVSPHCAGPSSAPAQPSRARQKVKRRSGLVFIDKTSTPSTPEPSPQSVPGDCPPQPRPRKPATSLKKRKKLSPEADKSTGVAAARVPRVRPGNKRTPDTSPATLKKKQCTLTSPLHTPPAVPASTHTKAKTRGKRRVSGVNRALYHLNITATDSDPNTTITPVNTPEPPPPPPPSYKRDHSPKTPKPEGDTETAYGTISVSSPNSPSTRMAALTLASPSPKPRKVRRRSARLSIGSEGIEEPWKMKDPDLQLGTFWLANSPMERKAEGEGSGGGGGGYDPSEPSPPSSVIPARKNKQTKTRRRSSRFLPMPEMRTEPTTTTDTNPTFSITPSSPMRSPPHPEAVQDPLTSPPHLITPTPIPTPLMSDGGRFMGACVAISPSYSSESSAPSNSPTDIKNIAFCKPMEEGSSDFSTPSPKPPPPILTPQPTPSTLTPSQVHTPLTPYQTQFPVTPLNTPQDQPAPSSLTPFLKQLHSTFISPHKPPATPTSTQQPQTTLFPSLIQPQSTLTSPQKPLATPNSPQQPQATLTPSLTQPQTTLTPSLTQPQTTLTSPQKPLATPNSPQQPQANLTPSLTQPQTTLTSPQKPPATPTSPQHPSTVTPSQDSPALPPATPTPPPDTHTPGAPRRDYANPEDDWDSPILAGIMTNETLIRMGQLYYGKPLSPLVNNPL